MVIGHSLMILNNAARVFEVCLTVFARYAIKSSKHSTYHFCDYKVPSDKNLGFLQASSKFI